MTRVGDEWLIVYTGFSRSGPSSAWLRRAIFEATSGGGRSSRPRTRTRRCSRRQIGGRFAMSTALTQRRAERRHLALVEPRPRALGRARVCSAPAGGLLGRRQDRDRPSAPPHLGRWLILYHGVKDTAAGAIYRLGLALLETGESRARPGTDEGVGVRAGRAVRALRRRRQRRLSVRLAPRSGWRHAPRLLRSGRHEPLCRDSKPFATARAPHPGQVEPRASPSDEPRMKAAGLPPSFGLRSI